MDIKGLIEDVRDSNSPVSLISPLNAQDKSYWAISGCSRRNGGTGTAKLWVTSVSTGSLLYSMIALTVFPGRPSQDPPIMGEDHWGTQILLVELVQTNFGKILGLRVGLIWSEHFGGSSNLNRMRHSKWGGTSRYASGWIPYHLDSLLSKLIKPPWHIYPLETASGVE